MATVAIVHKCTILHPLMWVFFEPNCVKGLPFSILQNYPLVDVIALIIMLSRLVLCNLNIFPQIDYKENSFKITYLLVSNLCMEKRSYIYKSKKLKVNYIIYKKKNTQFN